MRKDIFCDLFRFSQYIRFCELLQCKYSLTLIAVFADWEE